jgi:prepilin-type processing-associated H-X9-DG protein
MFYMMGSTAVCYEDPDLATQPLCEGGPDRGRRHYRPVKLSTVVDGTSKTFLFGEKYNYDPNFDAIQANNRSDLKIHEWAQWAYSGDTKGTGHVMRSAAQPINHQTPSNCGGGYVCQDNRLNAWGSGHPGGAVFVFADGSARFINDSISSITLLAWSTRDGGETVNEN